MGEHARALDGDALSRSATTTGSNPCSLCRPQADRIVIDRGRRVTDTLPDYEALTPTAELFPTPAAQEISA